MNKGRILFTDLDGTLLSSDTTISERNRIAIKKMLADGKLVVATTGRPLVSAKKAAEELGLMAPGCYMIAFNGAVIYDCSEKKMICDRTIPMPLVQQLFQKARQAGIYIQTYDKRNILSAEYTKELHYYTNRTKMTYQLLPDIPLSLKEEPNKVILISLEGRKILEDFKRDNSDWTQEKLSSFFSCDELLEYCPAGVSKGAAVTRLCEIFHIPLEQAVAVGDEWNDISMIKAAGIGAAVKNAADAVKEAADYITEYDNDHDAVAEIIEKFLL